MPNEEIKVQLEQDGKDLMPKTKAKYVYNNSGEHLGNVEAGAERNAITSIEINGILFTVDANRKASATIASADYDMVKQATADTGYAATYYLTKDGVQQGAKIQIMKDQVLDDVQRKVCTVADQPVQGYEVGDVYWEFSFQNVEKHIYLNMKEFFDVYTGGNGISVVNNVIAIDLTDTTVIDAQPTENSNKLVKSGGVYSKLAEKQNTINATNKLNADYLTEGATNKLVSASEKEAWSGKQNAITSSSKLDADLVDDTNATHKFVSATEKTAIGTIGNKANSADVYLKTETYSKTEINAMNLITYRQLTED